jgi:hypothetical protein
MGSVNQVMTLDTNHLYNTQISNFFVQPVTRKEIEYKALMKDPTLKPLWKRGFGNELGRLFQVIHDIQGTNTCFFVDLANIPKDRQITYGTIACDYKPHKKGK